MYKLLKILRFIGSHPLNQKNKITAIFRFVQWQLKTKFDPKIEKIVQFGISSKIIIRKNLTGATGNYYCGLHDFEEMALLLHFLREKDLFLDIGANVGSYTILASNERKAKSIAFEPSPNTFKTLSRNIELNEIKSSTVLHNKGVGSKKATLQFTKGYDTINHIATGKEANIEEIEVDSIDNMVEINSTCLAKIDVEGFETEVIKGMSKTLENEHLKAIIIELNGSGGRYGFDEEAIHHNLLKNGFTPYKYQPEHRKLIELDERSSTNTIYARDLEFVNQRLLNAPRIVINDFDF